MGKQDVTFLMVPLFALLALLVPSLGGRPKTTKASLPTTEIRDSAATETIANATDARVLANDYGGSGLGSPGAQVQDCLIATLPDPIDAANLGYVFDRYLDALQRAMETAGYVLDSFDLPWFRRVPSNASAAGAVAGEDASPNGLGRLLFRQISPVPAGVDKSSRALALVYIVGETPTAGINTTAFRRAVNELSSRCRGSQRINVLGPSFSGSQDSLHLLLKTDPAHQYNIVTGSATAIDPTVLGAGLSTSMQFRRTLASASEALRAYLNVIVEREERRWFERFRHVLEPFGLAREYRTKVALLVESNTGYGRTVARDPTNTASSKREPAASSTPATVVRTAHQNEPSQPLTCEAGETAAAPEWWRCADILEIPFPLHVSSLRAIAGDSNGTGGNEKAGNDRSLTHINIREVLSSRMAIPLASQLESSSIEIVLSTLLESLEEEHVKYIGIAATDVRDRLFLAQQVRHHLPNSVLFTTSADLLYAHPDVSIDLRGTQLVTSYPLFEPNQVWSSLDEEHRSRFLFGADTAQGVYNAALVLLNKTDQLQEYGPPLTATSHPPLWLSVVGNGDLRPVRLLDKVAPDGTLFDVPPRQLQHDVVIPIPNHPWLPTVAVVVCVFPAFYIFSNLSRQPSGSRFPFRRGSLAELFGESLSKKYRLGRRVHLFACWSALTAAYLLTTATFLLPRVAELALHRVQPTMILESSTLSTAFQLSLVIGAAILLATLAILGFRIWREVFGAHSREAKALAVGITAASSGMVLLSVWVSYRWLTAGGATAALVLYVRSADFTSGVSPLFPILLIASAAVLWAVSALRRLRLIEGPDRYPFTLRLSDHETTAHTFLGLQGSSFEGIVPLERRVVTAIASDAPGLSGPVLLIVLAALIIAWGRLFGPRSIPSGEGAVFDALFAIGFLTVYIGLAVSFVRFVTIWRRLFQLLARLSWHPTVKAYARLHQSIPGKPKVNLTSRSQILTALEFSVDRGNQLVTLARDLTKPRMIATVDVPSAALTGVTSGPLHTEVPLTVSGAQTERTTADVVRERFTDRLREKLPLLEFCVHRAETHLHAALGAAAVGNWRQRVVARTRAEQHLAIMAVEITALIRPAWRLPAKGAPEKGKEQPNEVDWFELAEDFLTSRVAAFLSHIVPQLQNLIVFVTSGLLLMLLAVNCYPFQPHQLLLLFNTAVVCGSVAVTFIVFVQMERETILSVLSDTDPGRVNWNREFISRLVVYIVLPLVSLLSAQFPEVAQQLYTWTSSIFAAH
jgi:hypothetical protein